MEKCCVVETGNILGTRMYESEGGEVGGAGETEKELSREN